MMINNTALSPNALRSFRGLQLEQDTLNSTIETQKDKNSALLSICRTLSEQFEEDREVAWEVQREVSSAGLGEAILLQVIRSSQSGTENEDDKETQETAFHCLKWIVLDNTDTCEWLLEQDDFLSALQLVLDNAATEACTAEMGVNDKLGVQRTEALIRLINTVTRTLWSAHGKIASLFTPAISKLIDPRNVSPRLRVQCVNHFLILSCDKSVVSTVLSAQTALTDIAVSQDGELNSIAALLAVANSSAFIDSNVNGLGSGSDDENTTSGSDASHNSALMPLLTQPLMMDLKDALDRSLRGLDFPQGSRRFYTCWMLALGVANICQSKQGSELAKKVGMINVLRRCQSSDDPRVHSHAGKALQLLGAANNSIISTFKRRTKVLPNGKEGGRSRSRLGSLFRVPSRLGSERRPLSLSDQHQLVLDDEYE